MEDGHKDGKAQYDGGRQGGEDMKGGGGVGCGGRWRWGRGANGRSSGRTG